MNRAIRGSGLALACATALMGVDADAQAVYRHTDEKGKVTFSDRPQEQAVTPVTAPPAPAQRPQGSGTRYEPTGPIIDYTGRYSEQPKSNFKTSGTYVRPNYQEKTLDQRLEEQHRLADDARRRQDQARERANEQDRLRVEREAKMRLEADKRKLRELQRENDRR
jgi:hypothetical protein